MINIYVGNLSFECDENELRRLFEQHGEVSSAKVVSDRFTGRPRGFAFVEMPDDAQGQAAIDALDGTSHMGRTIKVSMAQPRQGRRPPMDDR